MPMLGDIRIVPTDDDQTCRVERRSPLTGGVWVSMIYPHTVDEMFNSIQMWQRGALIQQVFPHFSAEQREFLMTGMKQDVWDEMLPDEDEEEDVDFVLNPDEDSA